MIKRLILALFVIMVVLGAYIFRSIIFRYTFPTATSQEINNSKVLVIAHRGASGHAPENTMAAIRKAVEMKSDLVEIDIHLSKDGEIVVFHDLTLDRTTNGFGSISETNWSNIALLDAGSWFSDEFRNERVPRLIDVLKYFKEIREQNGLKTQLLIEIKNGESGITYEGLVKSTIDLLMKYDDVKNPWCIIQAFNTDYLTETKNYLKHEGLEYAPPLHKLMYTDFSPLPIYIDFKLRLGYPNFEAFAAVNPNYRSLTKYKVGTRHKSGEKVFTYTVNDEQEMKRLIAMRVDGIITNYPDRLVKLKN